MHTVFTLLAHNDRVVCQTAWDWCLCGAQQPRNLKYLVKVHTVLSRDWTDPKPGPRIETEIKGAYFWLRLA